MHSCFLAPACRCACRAHDPDEPITSFQNSRLVCLTYLLCPVIRLEQVQLTGRSPKIDGMKAQSLRARYQMLDKIATIKGGDRGTPNVIWQCD